MFCNNCGKQIPDGNALCPQCGSAQSNQGTICTGEETPSVSFVEAIKLFFDHYSDFSGRSRRSEYWWAQLFINLFFFISYFAPLFFIADLAIIIPAIAVSVRRLHDIGKSGWWHLLFITPVIGPLMQILWLSRGSAPDNMWGPNPTIVQRKQKSTFVSAPPVAEPPMVEPPVANPPVLEPPAAVFPAQNTQIIPNNPAPNVVPPMPPIHPQAPAPAPQHIARPMASRSTPAVILEIISGPMAGKRYSLSPGKSASIGRNPSKCDIALAPYGSVSNVHCQITCYEDCVSITDLGSTNGSFVNSSRLPPQKSIKVNKAVTLHLANANCAIRIDVSKLRIS